MTSIIKKLKTLSTQNSSRERVLLTKFFGSVSKDKSLLIVILGFILYTVYFSYVTILKFYALNSSVFDLGLFMETLWSVYHTSWTPISFLISLSNQGLRFVFFPFAIVGSFPLLLAFQSFMLGVGVFPIYGIAKMEFRKTYSVLISLGYLLFFPLAGINLFDVHFQAFFIPFFLLAHYFYLKKKFILSAIFLFFSGITKLPYLVYPIMYIIIILIKDYRKQPVSKYSTIKYNKVFSILLIILIVLIIIGTYYIGLGYETNRVISSNNSISYIYDFQARIVTFMYLFAPFLFLPFLSKKWAIFTIPFLLILFTSHNANYYNSSSLFTLQYSSAILPFLFLGLIDSPVKDFEKLYSYIRKKITTKFLNSFFYNLSKIKTPFFVFLIIASLAFVYQPYGPFNGNSTIPHHIAQETNVNYTLYNDLNELIGLIPKNDPYVMFQNNMPQVLPRPLDYNHTPLLGHFFTANLSLLNKYSNVRIDYILIDPYSSWFTYSPNSQFPGTKVIYQKILNTSNFGILAQISGLTLFKRNYTGQEIIFKPIFINVPATDFYNASSGNPSLYSTGYNKIKSEAIFNRTLFFGDMKTLMPGEYLITYHLEIFGNNTIPTLKLQIINENIQNVKKISILNESYLKDAHCCSIINYSLNVNIDVPSKIQIRGIGNNPNSYIEFLGATILQIK